MKLVCGLGNPGRQYAGHRHNVGFQVVEVLAERLRTSFDLSRFDAQVALTALDGERVLLLKPQTFMNLSGLALAEAARFYKVGPPEVLVVHDELDLPFGRLQLKQGGGSGGHNGLKSIRESWGQEAYGRLRVGIGKPEGPGARERVTGHVLGDFSRDEQRELPVVLGRAVDMAEGWLRLGMQKAMNTFNGKDA